MSESTQAATVEIRAETTQKVYELSTTLTRSLMHLSIIKGKFVYFCSTLNKVLICFLRQVGGHRRQEPNHHD